MKKIIVAALCLVALTSSVGCWVPVQIAAGGADVVYVLDWKSPSFLTGEGRVMRCTGPNMCVEVYHP